MNAHNVAHVLTLASSPPFSQASQFWMYVGIEKGLDTRRLNKCAHPVDVSKMKPCVISLKQKSPLIGYIEYKVHVIKSCVAVLDQADLDWW